MHNPVLGSGSSTNEVLPVNLLREFDSAIHLRSGASIADFLSRLPSISVAGIAPPAVDRVVRPELAGVYNRLANGITRLSAGLHGPAALTEALPAVSVPSLRLMHYSQVAFGRLDAAWEQAVQQRQKLQSQQQESLIGIAAPVVVKWLTSSFTCMFK
jgi:hypothetical protein